MQEEIETNQQIQTEDENKEVNAKTTLSPHTLSDPAPLTEDENNEPITNNQQINLKYKKKEKGFKPTGIYSRSKIHKNIILPITSIGNSIQSVIEKNIKQTYEGICIVEGYIKPNSTKIITYSSGLIKGDTILFDVVFECDVCFPVEGMHISCIAKNITKAGIRAESAIENPSPIVVFIARDHNYSNDYFSEIKEGDKFNARVIGQRFELKDKYISIIAEIINPKNDYKKGKSKENYKQKLIIEE
jgi:DNA-directed RNA polymerase subunit E'/Rpb7